MNIDQHVIDLQKEVTDLKLQLENQPKVNIIHNETYHTRTGDFMVFTRVAIMKLPNCLAESRRIIPEDFKSHFEMQGIIVAGAINDYLLASHPLKEKTC